jgi:hypothetical protein
VRKNRTHGSRRRALGTEQDPTAADDLSAGKATGRRVSRTYRSQLPPHQRSTLQAFGKLGIAEDGDWCGEIGIGRRPVTHIRAREGYVDRDHVTADDPARFPFADGLRQIREGGKSCVFFAGG